MSVRFAGYAAVFNAMDRGGDVVRPGAFGPVRPVPLLWQHRGAPVGTIEAIGEDARGLRVIGGSRIRGWRRWSPRARWRGCPSATAWRRPGAGGCAS